MKEIIPINWHTKVLKEHRKEIIYSAASSFVVSLGYLIWSYAQGSVFVWQSISPIEQPSILVRVFYSALAFAVPGYLTRARNVSGIAGLKHYDKERPESDALTRTATSLIEGYTGLTKILIIQPQW
jgi:hypothetical protein